MNNSLNDFNRRLTHLEFDNSKEELAAKINRLEKKQEKTQEYFEENISKLDDQVHLLLYFLNY